MKHKIRFNKDFPKMPLQRVRHSLSEKIAWVESYLQDTEQHVDILNTEFVNAYINEFGVAYRNTNYGALKCPDVGRTLKAGYDQGVLKRDRIGLWAHETGFPNWIFVYRLNHI